MGERTQKRQGMWEGGAAVFWLAIFLNSLI